MYLNNLFISDWDSFQAPTQYQGPGSTHELAALLVTEVVQHSKSQKLPLFLLFLDAKSAFDTVVTEFLFRYLYLAGIEGDALLLLKNRLMNRQTYLDWDKTIMGPIFDEHGVEQGGVNSSEFYKLYNNELLVTLQKSCQGVRLGQQLTVSAVGQADDVVICANNIYMLYNLLQLALSYCKKLKVDLCADKTKLLLFADNSFTLPNNPIKINDESIGFSESAEHVGVIRSTKGNLANLMNRINSSKKATNATLANGLARGHRSNPAACIRVLNLYGIPVLMSGLASQVLSTSEVTILHQHHKSWLQNLQKLHDGTPQAVTYFLAGSLPSTAILHIRQLCLLGMISRLPDDPLYHHACYTLTTGRLSSNSWFSSVRTLCLQYSLPHPLSILVAPPSKFQFKN